MLEGIDNGVPRKKSDCSRAGTADDWGISNLVEALENIRAAL
jgi:hypothetical protein